MRNAQSGRRSSEAFSTHLSASTRFGHRNRDTAQAPAMRLLAIPSSDVRPSTKGQTHDVPAGSDWTYI
jgi:hypothetical protein